MNEKEIKEQDENMKRTNMFLVVNTVLIVAVLCLILPKVLSIGEEDLLDVTESMELKVQPDEVVVIFSIVSLDKDIQKAINENTEINNRIVNYFKGNDEIKVETQSYSISEKREWNESSKKYDIIGFEVYNTIKITSKNIDDAGEIITEALSLGANRVETVNYQLSREKRKELEESMLEDVFEKTVEKANTLASLMDKKIVEVKKIVPGQIYYPIVRMDTAAYNLKNENTGLEVPELSPSEQTVSLTVTTTFKVK